MQLEPLGPRGMVRAAERERGREELADRLAVRAGENEPRSPSVSGVR